MDLALIYELVNKENVCILVAGFVCGFLLGYARGKAKAKQLSQLSKEGGYCPLYHKRTYCKELGEGCCFD